MSRVKACFDRNPSYYASGWSPRHPEAATQEAQLPHIELKLKDGYSPNSPSNIVPETQAYNSDKHLIFLIRKHPQSVGGVQRHSARLSEGFSQIYKVDKINWYGPEWGAPIYFPVFYQRAIRNGAHLVHCDDAVTALIGAKIRENSSKKVIATVHGLDVILPIQWYQNRLKKALGNLDKIVCVSRATAAEVINRGIPPEKIAIIPNAAEKIQRTYQRNDSTYARLKELTGYDFKDKIILYSLGRPLKRKGFDSFAASVMPYLPDDFIYVVAGPKPKIPSWINTFKPIFPPQTFHKLLLASGCYSCHNEMVQLSKNPRIIYINEINDEIRNLLFAVSDLFIMPNRTIEGDMEGFGIVALEASARGVPVVATGIEGITDAVIDGRNGYCVAEGDFRGMAEVIAGLINNPQKLAVLKQNANKLAQNEFSMEAIIKKYEDVFQDLLSTK